MSKEIFAFAFTFIVLGEQLAAEDSLREAYLKGAEAKIVYRVVDEKGLPVEGAVAHIWFRTTYPKLVISEWIVSTDSNGMFTAAHKTNDRLSCGIDKPGYYHTFDRVTFSDPRVYPSAIGGKWRPYGDVREIVLKKIRRPGELHTFANSLRQYRIPEFDKWIGFDLECGEWVTPHGEGRYADMLLRFSAKKNGVHDYRYVMDVSFTNNPCAGAYILDKETYSDLQTKYNADSNATYKTTFVYVKEQKPGNKRHWDFLDNNSYLVFRTRTRIDQHGNLLGAHYGKILGEWFSGNEYMTLSDGCFNPVENDVNIEDGTVLRRILKNMKSR